MKFFSKLLRRETAPDMDGGTISVRYTGWDKPRSDDFTIRVGEFGGQGRSPLQGSIHLDYRELKGLIEEATAALHTMITHERSTRDTQIQKGIRAGLTPKE